MTHSRWLNFRSGLPVSKRSTINPQALTPTQKMELARNRIWGNYVGGNYRSGFKQMKQLWSGRTVEKYYDMHNLKMIYPFIDNWEEHNKKK